MSPKSFWIRGFADDLQNYIDRPHQEDPSPEGQKLTKLLQDTALAADVIATIGKQVEFYVNGEISKETLLKRYEEIEKESEAKLARIAK